MRGSQTRHQEAKYQYRSVAVARTIFCGYGPHLDISVPEDLLELKNVAIHASIVFDVSVSAPNRVLHWIGGAYVVNPYPDQTVSSTQPAMIHVLESADANRRVDVTIDISHLIPQIEIDDNPTFDRTIEVFAVQVLVKVDAFAYFAAAPSVCLPEPRRSLVGHTAIHNRITTVNTNTAGANDVSTTAQVFVDSTLLAGTSVPVNSEVYRAIFW